MNFFPAFFSVCHEQLNEVEEIRDEMRARRRGSGAVHSSHTDKEIESEFYVASNDTLRNILYFSHLSGGIVLLAGK
jgi:hypothetical protein